MTSERPPRGPLESNPDELLTRAGVLARAARRLAATRDVAEVQRVFGQAVTTLFGQGARWELHPGAGDSGEMARVVAPASAMAGMGAGVIAGLPEHTMDGTSSVVVAPLSASGTRDALVVPLGRGGKLGSLLVGAPEGAGPFGSEDVELVAALGAQITLALDRIRSLALRGSARRIKTDLRAAREVQQSLLPREPPPSCGFLVRAAYIPCFEVGGDCYDFAVRGPGELTVLIGDAAGKGVAAAILMTRVSAEFHGLVGMGLAPGAVLSGLNRSLTRRPAGEGFATALCVHFSTAGSVAVAANAGHVLPLLRRASGEVRAFAPPSGAPLGFVDDEAYLEDRAAIARGDIVVLMTDGLLDALGHATDELGMAHAVDLIARAPHDVDALRAFVLSELERLRARERRQRDDVTMVVVQVG